jgi:hypothetical protein
MVVRGSIRMGGNERTLLAGGEERQRGSRVTARNRVALSIFDHSSFDGCHRAKR